MHGFKSAFWQKKHYENGNKFFFRNMSKGPPNPGFMQKKVQKGGLLKKDSQ